MNNWHLWDPKGLDGHSHSVLLLADLADQKRIHDILNSIGDPPQADLLKVMLDAPLLEVAQQLQPCLCYLGNDSGITHLAAMLGVPTVVLFGPSDPVIWHLVSPTVSACARRPGHRCSKRCNRILLLNRMKCLNQEGMYARPQCSRANNSTQETGATNTS